MDRTVLHCDCNSFYASVEAVLDPKLKDVPMAVCGNPENRHGIILAKNELAKKFDIKTAETIYQAKKKCPDLVLVAPHHELYDEFSVKANDIYKQYTDLVEPFGIDESWLDVTASRLLFGCGEQIANEIRERFISELGITCSVGVSFNKSIAKLGSDYKKPNATTVITRDNFSKIVHPLPVGSLLFAGKSASNTLNKMGIFTIGDLANANRATIEKHLGKLGATLFDYACGNDDSPVESIYKKYEQKSISNGKTFKRDLKTREDVKQGVIMVAQELTIRMRSAHVKASTISVSVKYSDFTTKQKQRQLDYATNLTKDFISVALELVYSLFDQSKPIRLITIGGNHLVDDSLTLEQLTLFSSEKHHDKQQKAEDAIDKIRKKFGSSSVELGSILNNNDL